MKPWTAIGLTLVGIGGSLLSGGSAFAEEESHYCAQARKLEAQDQKAASMCGIAPYDLVCTTTVGGREYRGGSSSCGSGLTGIYQGLCRDEQADQGPLNIECCETDPWAGVCPGDDCCTTLIR
jgi:hypothetical protein